MTARQEEILRELGGSHRQRAFWRPMDLGGRDASWHSRALQRLVKLGYAERKTRGSDRSYAYRITPQGIGQLLILGYRL